MSDAARGTSAVADRPVKVCPGVEGRPCGKEIPAIRTWCVECSAERRKLKRSGYSSDAYQADPEPRREKQRARYRLKREIEDCEVIIKMTAWIKRDMDRERDLRAGFTRPLTPAPYPKAYLRMRQPRRDRIYARAQDLVIQEILRAKERMNKYGRILKHFPYRPPRLRDILPEPEPAAETTISGGQYKTRVYRGKKRGRSKKKRGRPRLTEEQKTARRLQRAVSLYIRVEQEEMPLDEAWYAVNPQSKASPENATREARRELAWLRREHPPTLEDRLYLSGMSDLDGICREIKALLEANRPARGKLPERPDWYARTKGLKLLMKGLGLATWRGFRSGPYAVGGELEDVPVERNDVPAGDEDSVADVKRRIKAQGILFRNQVEGKPLADCWLELTPHSKANRITAKKEAEKLLDYFQKRYSSSLSERLVANGLDESVVIATIKALKEAGRASDSQWKLLSRGLDMQMVILGCRPPSGRSVPRQAMGFRAMSRLYGEEPADHALDDQEPEDLEPEEAAPAPLSPDEARRRCAADIYVRHYFEGKPLAAAWLDVHPDEKDRFTEEAAAAAERELAWFRETYPMPMATLMEAHDLGIANLLKGVEELQGLTTRLVSGRTWAPDEKGKLVLESVSYIHTPNNRARMDALHKQVILLGFGPGGWRQPVPREEESEESQELQELPKTLEEAKALGIPYTFIVHPERVTPEQWQKNWDDYNALKKRLRADELSDEWLAYLASQRGSASNP